MQSLNVGTAEPLGELLPAAHAAWQGATGKGADKLCLVAVEEEEDEEAQAEEEKAEEQMIFSRWRARRTRGNGEGSGVC